MLSNEIITQFSNLSSKYNFNKVISAKSADLTEIDELIKGICNYNTNTNTKLKTNKYYDNPIFVGERLLKFCKLNAENGDIFKHIFEQMHHKSLEILLNRYYEYMFTKVKNVDQEIYDELKIIVSSNRYTRRMLIKQFIDKWCSKEKKININL
jgi:hypothetical protein